MRINIEHGGGLILYVERAKSVRGGYFVEEGLKVGDSPIDKL
jgi:hypothetical protein